MQFYLEPARQIIVVGTLNDGAKEVLEIIRKRFLPFSVVHYLNKNNTNKLRQLLPFLNEYQAQEGKATVFVCQNHSCQAPVTEPQKLAELLSSD